MAQHTSGASDAAKHRVDSELRWLQIKTDIGFEVTVKWQPDTAEYGADGKKLAEIVRGNTIFIFSDSVKDAIGLTRHGFLEAMLNQHTRPYLRLINQLITLHEEQQYENKERIIEALTKLI